MSAVRPFGTSRELPGEPVDYQQLLTPEFVRGLPWDTGRGTGAMWWFIYSETMIFVGLFFSYFYLANHSQSWPPEQSPAITLPLIIAAILLVSCGVLAWGQRALVAGSRGSARLALVVCLLCGAAYIWLEVLSIERSLRIVTPQQDSYGSIFYTILTVHGAHLVVGMLLMAYALLLPLEPTDAPPHRAYYNGLLYWYFSTFVWLVVLCCMYLAPRLYR